MARGRVENGGRAQEGDPAEHGGPSRRGPTDAEQPLDAVGERAVGGRAGERGQAQAPALELRQGADIDEAIAGDGCGVVVTAMLALDAQAAVEPPGDRMVEEERDRQRLNETDKVVPAADMRELVGEHRVEVGGIDPGKQRDRR